MAGNPDHPATGFALDRSSFTIDRIFLVNRKILSPAVLLLGALAALGDSTIDMTDKYAYGANIGWINLEGDGTNGVVVGEFFLSGSAWGANVGWIDFGDGSPANGVSYANDSADDFGVNSDGLGNLSGYAYGANLGWINFEWAEAADPDRPRVDHLTGQFEGFAYGANVGWINLGAGYLATSELFLDDTDGDGMSDAWEIREFGDLTTATATVDAEGDRTLDGTDQDGDFVFDRDEYLAGSDPNDGNSFLTFTTQEADSSAAPSIEVTVTFTSSPTRNYQVVLSDDLQDFGTDSGLGIFAADPGATTTRTFQVPAAAKLYRVVAHRQPAPRP